MSEQRINELAKLLSISKKALDGRRKKLRMARTEDVEKELLRWLEEAWEENRDVPRLIRPTLPRIKFGPEPKPLNADEIKKAAEESAYTSNPYQAVRDEPESVPADYQNLISAEATAVFEVVKGEEKLKKQAKARAERLRQAELELRRKGKSPDHYLQAVEEAVKAMKDEAKAA